MNVELFYIAAGHALPAIAAGASSTNKTLVITLGVAAAVVGVLFGNPQYAALDIFGAAIGVYIGLQLSRNK